VRRQQKEFGMRKPGMFYCGVAIVILGLIWAVSADNPASQSQAIGGMLAGIVLAIIGGRKKTDK